jgi:hypothetical protein
MRTLSIIGAILLLLGVLSFVVPVPHTQDHSVKIGGARIGVETRSSDKLPPAASLTLVGVGILALILGAQRR